MTGFISPYLGMATVTRAFPDIPFLFLFKAASCGLACIGSDFSIKIINMSLWGMATIRLRMVPLVYLSECLLQPKTCLKVVL